MDPLELTLSITALANAIASNFSDEELAVLAAASSQLGDTLATILAQRILIDTQCKKDKTEHDNKIPPEKK